MSRELDPLKQTPACELDRDNAAMTRDPEYSSEQRVIFDLAAKNEELRAEVERLQAERKNCPPASESEYVRRLEAEIEQLNRYTERLRANAERDANEIARLKAQVEAERSRAVYLSRRAGKAEAQP